MSFQTREGQKSTGSPLMHALMLMSSHPHHPASHQCGEASHHLSEGQVTAGFPTLASAAPARTWVGGSWGCHRGCGSCGRIGGDGISGSAASAQPASV
eukprot:3803435-Rhodomonas_salina.1